MFEIKISREMLADEKNYDRVISILERYFKEGEMPDDGRIEKCYDEMAKIGENKAFNDLLRHCRKKL